MRKIDQVLEYANLRDYYNNLLRHFKNVDTLPINANNSFYEYEGEVFKVYNGEGILPLELAKKSFLNLAFYKDKEGFIYNLDLALGGETYDLKYDLAIKEFVELDSINRDKTIIKNKDYEEVLQKYFFLVNNDKD